MVILGTAGGLFAAGTSVFIVAVFQSAEMAHELSEQLYYSKQVVNGIKDRMFGRSIVLQGFPVSLITAAFDSAGVIIAVIGLSVFAMLFAYQQVGGVVKEIFYF